MFDGIYFYFGWAIGKFLFALCIILLILFILVLYLILDALRAKYQAWQWSRPGSKQYKRMMYRIFRFMRSRELSEYHQIKHYVVNEYLPETRPLANRLFDVVFNQAIADYSIFEVGESFFRLTRVGKDKFYSDELRG